MLTVEDAKDIIDIYGPHRKRWPPFEAQEIDGLLKSDRELATYLKRQQTIDSLLNNWQEDLDGAAIDLDEDDLEDGADDEEEEKFDDEDEDEDKDEEQDPSPPPPCDTEEQDDEADADPTADDPADEERPAITVDADDIADMDQMFSDEIRGLIDENADGQFNVFSRDRDGLQDIKVPEGQTLEAIDQAVMQAVGPLMKDLRRLIAARSQVRRIPGKRSGRLHAPSLHRIRTGDDKVFSRKEESPSLNTAITLLIDCSGSMGGSRIRLATETAYALGTVLNKLGIAFECIGFTDGFPDGVYDRSWVEEAYEAAKSHPLGRITPLIAARFKAFEDRWTIPTQKRFAAVRGDEDGALYMGSTPEGCGLEFAAKRLLGRSEDRKILICMTDGEPGCAGTGGGKSDKQHSKDMVAAITGAGVDLVGIGIQHDEPTKYYPQSLVIQNVTEMPKLLMGVLKKFIIG